VIGRRAASRGGMVRVLVMCMISEGIDFFVWRMAICRCNCEMLEQRYRWAMDHEEEVKRVTARSRDMDLPNSLKGARFRRRLRCTGTGTDLSFGSTDRQRAEPAAGTLTPAPFPRRLIQFLRISLHAITPVLMADIGLCLLVVEGTSSPKIRMAKELIRISSVHATLLRLVSDSTGICSRTARRDERNASGWNITPAD
jgi:hypothetical protein